MQSNQTGLNGSTIGGNMARVGVAEFLGTFFLVLAGTAVAVAGILHKAIAGSPADSLAVALAFGLVLVALIGALGHISGAHFNPAVTISLAVTGKFPWKYVPTYIIAQLAGAVAASEIVLYMFGNAARSVAFLGATFPAAGISALQVLIVEAIITFLLVFVIMSVATDIKVSTAVIGSSIGFALAAAVLIAGPITGAAVNPARALGPMIVSGRFTDWWAYIIGPVLGGIFAASVYNYFIAKAEQPKK